MNNRNNTSLHLPHISAQNLVEIILFLFKQKMIYNHKRTKYTAVKFL